MTFGAVRGSARSILVAERVALNFMQVGVGDWGWRLPGAGGSS
jgi:hypothetical protein